MTMKNIQMWITMELKNISRIMCVGPSRINETMVTLSFDSNLIPHIDKTYIFSPYSQETFDNLFEQFSIDSSKFTILDDQYFEQYYNLTYWRDKNWFKQQAFKLCALDHFDSDVFLIQDSDIVLLEPFEYIKDDKLNFKAEDVWNPFQEVYAHWVEKIIGMNRKENVSLVNELMPYFKSDWVKLKQHIEDLHQTDFLSAIANLKTFHKDQWFSEYELLGIYKTHSDNNWFCTKWQSQPPIDSWDDFYNVDWKQHHSIKFHTKPLKFMTVQEALDITKHIKENYVRNN